MSAKGKSLNVRHCRPEDKEAVLCIADVYCGFDHLYLTYNSYLEDPHRICYLLEVEELAVAFTVATVVDDGEGVVFQAGRTRSGHRQQGYQTLLMKTAIDELKARYPNLKEAMSAVAGRTPSDGFYFKIGEGRKLLSVKRYYCYSISTPEELRAARSALAQTQHLIGAVQAEHFGNITEYTHREDFRSLVDANRIKIGTAHYRIDVPQNFTMKNRFPDFFGLSFDSGSIDGVSFCDSHIDGAQHWQRHDVSIYCRTREAALKHIAFNQRIILEKVSHSDGTVHCLICIYPLFLDEADFNKTIKATFSVSGDLQRCFGFGHYDLFVSHTKHFA